MSEYTSEHAAPESPVVSSSVYDKMKSFLQLVGPALITFYLFAGHAYGWPNVEVNAGVAGAALLALGVVVTWLSNNFKKLPVVYDGVIRVVEQEDGVLQAGIELKNYENPAAIVEQQEALFKIEHVGPNTP